MNNSVIASEAMKKAVANGYRGPGWGLIHPEDWRSGVDYEEWIFLRPEWVQAFFGQEKWKMQLQQMVLEEDRIKYLEQFL